MPLFASRTDPHTGDTLTFGEWMSWKVQGVIRRWAFLGVFTAITLFCWLTANPAVLLWWNLNASYLAIFIESLVGMAMMHQTRRDALVLREVRALATRLELVETQNTALLRHIGVRVEQIEGQLEEQEQEQEQEREREEGNSFV